MNRLRALLYAIALLLVPSAALADTRVALVIGNSSYDAVGRLPNPERDAALMADALKHDGFTVILVQNAAHAAMLQALNAFNDQADTADWAFVYYAGHGIEVDGTNYLLPTDVKLKADRDAQDEAVPLDRVLKTVAHAHKLRIVVLDACRNNPFAATMHRSVTTRAVGRGLSRVEPASVMVVYSAAAGAVADDGAGEHSPFTASLAARIQQPGLGVDHLFNVVTADVLDATDQVQQPYKYGSIPSREELYFVPPIVAAPAVNPDPLRDGQQVEFATAMTTGTVEALTDFIVKYPSSPLATIARTELNRLQPAVQPASLPAPSATEPKTPPALSTPPQVGQAVRRPPVKAPVPPSATQTPPPASHGQPIAVHPSGSPQYPRRSVAFAPKKAKVAVAAARHSKCFAFNGSSFCE